MFRVGGGVSAPVLIHKVEPQYTEEARAAKYQGTVLLYVEIDPNGTATNIRCNGALGWDSMRRPLKQSSSGNSNPVRRTTSR